MRTHWIIGSLLAGLLALGGVRPAGAQAATAELRIGSSAALSGPAAALGTRYHVGAQAHFAQVNQRGGVHGARLVLDLLDDAYESDRTETNTRLLIEKPEILALFGYIGTPTSRVALPFVKRSGIAFVGAYTGADFLREPFNPLIFNVRASYRQEGMELARTMKKDGVRTFNIMYQADLFGRAGLEAIRTAAQNLDLRVGAIATVKRNSDAVEDAAGALIKNSASDAIFLVSSYGTSASFVRRARELGYRGRFYTLSFAGLEPLSEALGRDMKGLTISQVVPDAENRSLPIVAEYQLAMRAAGEQHFDALSLEGFIAARVLVEGLRRARPPLSRQSVLQGLEAIGQLDLGGLRVRYGPNLRIGSDFVDLRVGR